MMIGSKPLRQEPGTVFVSVCCASAVGSWELGNGVYVAYVVMFYSHRAIEEPQKLWLSGPTLTPGPSSLNFR